MFSKMNFLGGEIFEGFSIDRLSQMTLVLDNSLFSKKDKLSGMIKWDHINVYIFTWKHSQSNALFLFEPLFFYFGTYLFWTLLVVLRHPHQRARWVISDWTVLEVNTQERRLLEQTDQWLTLTFRWKLNKQRCVRERMSILSFNIVTVVYGINLKILMSH